jgi:gliding motility-associated-like protein
MWNSLMNFRALALVAALLSYLVTSSQIITSTGCEGLTNYTNGDPNHRVFYFPFTTNTPGVLSANSAAPLTYVWSKYVIEVVNAARNGWVQVQLDANATSSSIINQGMGAYLLQRFDGAGNYVDHEICWIQVLRPPAALPEANITNSNADCDGPVVVNGQANGTSIGILTIGGSIANPATIYSYSEVPPLPVLINASTEIEVCIEGSQNNLSNLVFGLVGPESCNSPVVILGSTPNLTPPVQNPADAATGNFNCNFNGTVNYNLCFTNDAADGAFNICSVSNGVFSGNVFSTANNANIPFDWSPIYGCDATNGDWTVEIWDCGIPSTQGTITDISISFNGGYLSPTVNPLVNYAASPNLLMNSGNGLANCGLVGLGTSYNFPGINITPYTCNVNGYEWYTLPEFIMPAGSSATLPNSTANQNTTLTLNSLQNATGPQPWQDFEVNLSITNVCHQAGIDNGCMPTMLATEDIVLTTSGPAVINPQPILCTTGAPVNLTSTAGAGEWTGIGITNTNNGTFNPSIGSGTYTINFDPTNPCFSNSTINIVVEAPGDNPPNFNLTTTVLCADAVPIDVSADADETGTFSGSGISSGGIFNPTGLSGSITLTFTSTEGCPEQVQDNITVNVLPSVSITQGNAINFCDGSSVQLNAQGANTYVWSNAASLTNANIANPTATPGSTTTYTVTGTNVNGCEDEASITLNEINNTTPLVTPNQTICINNSNITLNSNTPGGIWSGTSVVSGVFSPATAVIGNNILTYTVTDNPLNGNCYNDATTTITVDALPNVTATGTATICEGATAPLDANGATSYSWSPGIGLDDASIESPSATPALTTSYLVTGTTGACSDTMSVIITVLPIVDPVITAVDTLCSNGTAINLSVVPGGGTWSGAPVAVLSAAGNFNPTVAGVGNFNLTYDAGAQCVNDATIELVVAAAPITEAGAASDVCVGDGHAMNGSGAINYSWSPTANLSSSTQPNATVTPLAPGSVTYTLTGTGIAGCQSTDQVTLDFIAVDYPQITPAGPYCTSDTPVNMIVDIPGGSWVIGGLPNIPGTLNPSLIATDTAMVVYSLGNVCSTPDTIYVEIFDPTDYELNLPADVCIDGPIYNLSDSISYTGTFVGPGINNGVTGNFNPALAGIGNHIIQCNINDVCTLTLNANIEVHALPTVNAGPDTQVCFDQPFNLNALGAVSYTWSPSTYLNNVNVSNPQCTPTNAITYTVQGTDAFGCVNSDDISISLFDFPQVSVDPESIVCPNSPVQLNATGSAGTFSWAPATNIIDGNTATPTVQIPQTTVYTVTLTDPCGITADASVTVPVEPIYQIIVPAETFFCENSSVIITAIPGGVNPDYVWTTQNGTLGADSLSTQINVSDAGTYTFNVTTPLGCIYQEDVIVDEVPLPVLNLPDTSFLCLGEVLDLYPGVWDEVNWATGANSATLPVETPGLYSVTVTEDGCSSSDTFLVVQVVVPYFNLGVDRIMCDGDTIFIAADIVGEWNTGVTDSTIMVVDEGDYAMTVYVGTCFRTDSVHVEELLYPTSNLPEEVTGCDGTGIILDASGADIEEYYWSTGDTSASITVFDIDEYEVRISNYCGIDTFHTNTRFEVCSSTIFIPNSFTPDGDGINDYWRIYASNVGNIDIMITNRTGEIVFRTDNPDKAWLGDKNEARYYVDDGIYFYTIIYKDENDDTQKLTGTVLLLR